MICCAVSVATWLGVQWWPRHTPQDFEQCSEVAEATASSKDERMSLIAQCDRQFAGRRKAGGGYTYYDFLQNRQFDIAGPNPTPNELKHFDEQYTLYLDGQRREAVAAARAEQQSRIEQQDAPDDRITRSIPPREATVIAPTSVPDDRVARSISPRDPTGIAPTNVPIPRARSEAVRSKGQCEDASLSCSWTRFSAGVKKFFESNAKLDHP